MGFNPKIINQDKKRERRKQLRREQIERIRAWRCDPKPGVIVLPYPPSGNHFYTVAHGRKILSDVGRAYKAKCEQAAREQFAGIIDGDVSVRLNVYRPTKIGDLENTMKGLLDSLSGVAWHDDKQIVHIDARRHDDKSNPRVEVQVNSVPDAA